VAVANDVHKTFKCMEETVLGKAFVYEKLDGRFTTLVALAKRMMLVMKSAQTYM